MSKLSLGVAKVAAEQPRGDTAETAIARLTQADRALAEAIEVADAVTLVATGKALREWASAVHAGRQHERQAAVFVLRAMRNAGERLAEGQARGEVATPQTGRAAAGLVDDGDKTPATLTALGVTRDESSDWQRLAREYPTDEALTEATELLEKPTLTGALRLAPLMSSNTPEWYTPPEVIERVVATLGAVDLDPCSNGKGADARIPATTHYTAEDDGLSQPWRGRIYMNPPYGRDIVGWIDKLAEEFEYGNVTEAIALVPARVDTGWWWRLPAEWVCFVRGRLTFSDHENAAPFPSAAVYLGPDASKFVEQFSTLGRIYRTWEAAA